MITCAKSSDIDQMKDLISVKRLGAETVCIMSYVILRVLSNISNMHTISRYISLRLVLSASHAPVRTTPSFI